MVCCLIIIGINGQYLGEAVRQIIEGAFTPVALPAVLSGSTVALALQFGFKRGTFSNESGMGSAPLAAASATTKNPARQALVSMTGTFWDTVVVCLITGLMLMTTLIANPELSTAVANGTILLRRGPCDRFLRENPRIRTAGTAGGPAHLHLFHHPRVEPVRQPRDSYLHGKKAVLPYYIVFLLFVFWGCMMVGDASNSAAVSNLSSTVWDFADVMNALMAIPNCIAVLGLSAVIARETSTMSTMAIWRKSTTPRFRNTTRNSVASIRYESREKADLSRRTRKGGFFSSRKPPALNTLSGGFCPSRRT